jgi:hypothetical protein
MKKTYHNSPALFVMTFVAFSLLMFLILLSEGHFVGNQVNYLINMAVLGVLLLLGWAFLFITIDTQSGTITRRLALFFVSTRRISDTEDIREVSDSDIYGTSRTMQIRFKTGDKWNLGLLNRKDMRELVEAIRKCRQRS